MVWIVYRGSSCAVGRKGRGRLQPRLPSNIGNSVRCCSAVDCRLELRSLRQLLQLPVVPQWLRSPLHNSFDRWAEQQTRHQIAANNPDQLVLSHCIALTVLCAKGLYLCSVLRTVLPYPTPSAYRVFYRIHSHYLPNTSSPPRSVQVCLCPYRCYCAV